MDSADAIRLIGDAVPGPGGTWADLGAGTGTFTRALAALLGPAGRVYAVDRDPRALAALRAPVGEEAAPITPVVADLRDFPSLPGLAGVAFDGVLLANALHFVADPGWVLGRVAGALAPGGRVLVVEYDHRPTSRWVPYPLSRAHLAELMDAAGLGPTRVVGERPSAYGGVLYAATADLREPRGGAPV